MDENFRYKTINYSLHHVLRQIESRRMEVEPDFKELKSWSLKDKSQFIESLILGIPTQPVWCEETASGDYIVIEGSERLSALVDFAKGKFTLTGLKIRKEYIGYEFAYLPYYEKLALEDRYTFTFIIINYDTPPQLKYEFFRRLLNDTGGSNDQSARNFAWPTSFKLLQLIKNESEDLISFAPRDSRWRFQPKAKRDSSAIDEFFLFLLTILVVLRGDIFEEAYLDNTVSIEDLLDWTMKHYDEMGGKAYKDADFVLWGLKQIEEHLGKQPKVILTNTIRTSYMPGDNLVRPELYLLFVRACANKLDRPINWAEVKAQRFITSSSARSFISHIFQSRDD